MSRRFQGGESSEILNQSSVKNEDMIQCRHEVGTVNDSDKAIPLSVIQSCPVATCETAGGTAAKVGVVNNFSDFTLLNGREVLVYFASGNTVDNPTFNLNNTGAFPLALENQLSTVSIGSGCWGDGVFLHLKYVDITVSNTRIQKWIICGHRIASQSNTQTTYADGQGRTNEVAANNMQSVTSNAINERMTRYILSKPSQLKTNININGYDGGRTILVLMSSNANVGDDTLSIIGMIRCGYSANNYSIIEIARNSGYSSATTLQDMLSIDNDGYIIITTADDTGWLAFEFICNR